MNALEQTLRIENDLVDARRTLRPSSLLLLLQQAAIHHTEQLGMGREKTLDRGLLWAVTRQQIEIDRLPVYDERVVLTSWPGQTMHVLFPRYSELRTERGERLVRASALWVLLDAGTRAFVFPEEHGISLPGMDRADQLPLPQNPAVCPAQAEVAFTVPYSYLDLNGHMNNIRYLDLAEDLLPDAFRDLPLRQIRIAHLQEARLGQTIAVELGGNDTLRTFSGRLGKPCFQLSLHY